MKLYEIVGDLDFCLYPDLDSDDNIAFVAYSTDRIFVRCETIPNPAVCFYLLNRDRMAYFFSYNTETQLIPPVICHLPRYNSQESCYPRVNRDYSRLVVVSEEFAFIAQTKTEGRRYRFVN